MKLNLASVRMTVNLAYFVPLFIFPRDFGQTSLFYHANILTIRKEGKSTSENVSTGQLT